jgi:hypothetical protein
MSNPTGDEQAAYSANPGQQYQNTPGPGQYPPPGFAAPGYPPPGNPTPGYQQPGNPPPGYQQPGYQQPGYQQPGYQQPGYWQPGPYQQMQPAQSWNGLAIASMVVGIVWIYWVGSILAVIFGHVALRQTARDGSRGRGMAIAGLVLGYIGMGTLALVIIGALAHS